MPKDAARTAEVTLEIAAPADTLYGLVSDLPRMGEWSPECERVDWLKGAGAAVPGARFKGRNRRGKRRWSTTGEVVVAEPGKELTFDISSLFGLPVARWSYRFEGSGSSAKVTESWEDRRGWFITTVGGIATGVPNRAEHNAASMQTTLEQLKATAEQAAG